MTVVTAVDDGDDGSYKEGSERGQPPSRVLPPPPRATMARDLVRMHASQLAKSGSGRVLIAFVRRAPEAASTKVLGIQIPGMWVLRLLRPPDVNNGCPFITGHLSRGYRAIPSEVHALVCTHARTHGSILVHLHGALLLFLRALKPNECAHSWRLVGPHPLLHFQEDFFIHGLRTVCGAVVSTFLVRELS